MFRDNVCPGHVYPAAVRLEGSCSTGLLPLPEHVSLELALGSRGVIDGSHSQQTQRDVPHVLQSHVASR